MRHGLLLHNIHFEGQGRRSLLQECRFLSMHDMHLDALDLVLTAEPSTDSSSAPAQIRYRGIQSIWNSRATPSRSAEMISTRRESHCALQTRPTTS